MARLKVLHLVHTPGPGGTEQVVQNLLGWTHPTSVIQTLGAPQGELGEKARALGVAFYPIPFHNVRRGRSPLRVLGTLGGLSETVGVLRNVLRQVEPDIVHSHGAKSTILAGLCAKRPRPWKLIWHLHDYLPLGPLRRILLFIATRQADRIVAVSADVAATVCGKRAVTVVPNAIDLSPEKTSPRMEELRGKLGMGSDTLLLGYAGRLDREKGLEMLLESMKNSRYPDLHLLVAGASPFRPTEMRAFWEGRAHAYGLADRVHFLGRLRDLSAFFEAIDVFVLPAPREPFGLVILEALDRGIPVVACAAGGPVDIIGSLQASLLVPPEDPRAFAEAYDRILSSRSIRETAQEEGPRHVAQLYTPEVQIKAIDTLYREILSS